MKTHTWLAPVALLCLLTTGTPSAEESSRVVSGKDGAVRVRSHWTGSKTVCSFLPGRRLYAFLFAKDFADAPAWTPYDATPPPLACSDAVAIGKREIKQYVDHPEDFIMTTVSLDLYEARDADWWYYIIEFRDRSHKGPDPKDAVDPEPDPGVRDPCVRIVILLSGKVIPAETRPEPDESRRKAVQQ